jgi:hypothetical protein
VSTRPDRDTSRRPRDAAIRISRRTLAIGVTAAGAIVALVLVLAIASFIGANMPRSVANAAEMKLQQTAAERDVERAFEQATDQVVKVRALNLAITADQADQISAKALTDLTALRHSAFVSLGQIQGLAAAEAETYATSVEGRFTAAPVSKDPSPSPVLLAPRYYTVVSRMSELATQLAVQATTRLTASPTSTPTPSPTPSSRPSPSPTR